MADKSIGQLNAAEKIYATDLFITEQGGSAKSVSGQVMINFLTSIADGHGGIQSIVPLSTSGLVKTFRITLADTTTFDFSVSDGKGIEDIKKTGTNWLVDTHTVYYSDGTTSTFTVTNGAKGDKGDDAYVWIRYASQKPTASSHSFGVLPDNWMGIYSGNAATAPTDWAQYQWFQIKGEKGDIGIPATLTRQTVEYQAGDSGTIIPSGAWSTSIPVVAQGKYLWTRTTLTYNTGDQVVSYSVSRFGLDGTGAVSSVAGVSPDPDGNVPLSASDVGALDSAGGEMTGPINMNGQAVTGLNDPTADTDAARKAYVDSAVSVKSATLTASGWSSSAPYTQTISVAGAVAENPPHVAPVYSGNTDADIALKEACAAVTYATPGAGKITFVCLEDKPGVDIPIQVEVRR